MPAPLTAGLAAAAHALARGFQGPDDGSPFVNAPLPFEEIKAAPDRALEVILLTVGVMFLAGLATAAFLALSKLRSIEETLEKELRQHRESRARAGEPSDDPSGDQVAAANAATLDEAAGRIEEALERTAASIDAAAARLMEAADADDRDRDGTDRDGTRWPAELAAETREHLAPVVAALEQAVAAFGRSSETLSGRLEALAQSAGPGVDRAEGPSSAEGPRAANGGAAPSRGTLLDRIHARLSALGFSEIEIVTPRDELVGDRLVAGEVHVEARRSGAIHKGTVTLEDGAAVDVQLRPSHAIFP